MKKPTISKLFLYRHRFIIGYSVLALLFVSLLFILPTVTPHGISEAEMQSAVDSYSLSFRSITSGNLVDLPYHILQKLSILFFGLNTYSIVLPSVIIGLLLGFLLVLLLNRWFKNNVALLASIITILSTPFLYLAGTGTPQIMLVFWPALLLWLGSKIQGVKKPRPAYCFVFAFIMLASIFTPYLVYLDLFILIFALAHPHLRFTIKSLPKLPLILSTIIIVAGLAVFAVNLINRPTDLQMLFVAKDFSLGDIWHNFTTAIGMLFAWSGQAEGVYLTPLISLATAFLAAAGLISTTKGFFASRNAIASYFILFTLALACLNPDAVMLIILPLSILTAHGLRYILQKWYGLFPENPYARIAGLVPIIFFISCILVTNFNHYVLGYNYNPGVAVNFNEDINIINGLAPGQNLVIPIDGLEKDFYAIAADRGQLNLISDLEGLPESFITLGRDDTLEYMLGPLDYHLERIITSPKSDNSDRIYVYSLS